nr:MAG TPA: hypothetical protein [Caudoviricetes sp.]
MFFVPFGIGCLFLFRNHKNTSCFICLSIAKSNTVYNAKCAQDSTINIVENVNLHTL